MASPNEMFPVIILLETLTGLFSSFSIIVCLSVKVFQMKNMMTYIKLLKPFKVSIICFTIILSLNLITIFRWRELYDKAYVSYIIMYMISYSMASSLWLAAVLCVFCFMKILPSQPGVHTTLKSRIGAVVWWLIAAEVVSLGGGFLSIIFSNPQINQRNSSLTMSELIDEYNMDVILMLNWLPFLAIIMTTFGSTYFPKLCNRQTEKNMATLGNPRVRDYGAAIQTMIGLLVLNSLIFVGFIQNVFVYGSLGYGMSVTFLFSLPTVLSALLLYGCPELKEALKQIFAL